MYTCTDPLCPIKGSSAATCTRCGMGTTLVSHIIDGRDAEIARLRARLKRAEELLRECARWVPASAAEHDEAYVFLAERGEHD